jgi:hypothetical protein
MAHSKLLGQMVHYLACYIAGEEQVRPAVITGIHDEATNSVYLTEFPIFSDVGAAAVWPANLLLEGEPGFGRVRHLIAEYDPTGRREWTWHWPEDCA